ADARSDVFSLGLTLYEMLTLRSAFAAKDRAQLIERVLHEEPVRPRKLDPGIPRDLETVVLKALAKEPASRYQSGQAVAEDLRRFLADRPIMARRSSLWERFWRWRRRNPLAAALVLAVVTTLLTGIAFSLFFAIQANEQAKQANASTEAAEQERNQAKA